MPTRTLGQLGWSVGEIGLGTEYLIPATRETIIEVVRAAHERGVTYYELFPAQPHYRDAMGEAFAPLRKEVILSAHLGSTVPDNQYEAARDVAVCRKWFEDYLRRFRTDYADVVFLHNVDTQEDTDDVLRLDGLLGLAQDYVKKGSARAVGFAGHTVSTSLQAVRTGAIDMLLFPVHLAGHTFVSPEFNSMASIHDLLQECRERGVAVVAMKPYGGGKLVERRPDGRSAATPVQCLAYTLSQPGVACAVPGCANVAELESALAYLDATPAERDYGPAIAQVNETVQGGCVYCNHCLPCPSEIDIAQVMRYLDRYELQEQEAIYRSYHNLVNNADDCIECGACEERCPFRVAIIERMRAAQTLFS
ncbi:MAG: 4Fe-4S binding protein [Chloroflexi bacterium]|nr:4Fe-4S binding protein [Chloroflexota bacterium]